MTTLTYRSDYCSACSGNWCWSWSSCLSRCSISRPDSRKIFIPGGWILMLLVTPPSIPCATSLGQTSMRNTGGCLTENPLKTPESNFLERLKNCSHYFLCIYTVKPICILSWWEVKSWQWTGSFSCCSCISVAMQTINVDLLIHLHSAVLLLLFILDKHIIRN